MQQSKSKVAQCEWFQTGRAQSNKNVHFPAVSGWKCQKCEMRENLWMNLTDGAVFCGKWFFDGSGGNGHALDHYKDTNHPLAVKLDTITPDGAGTAHMLICKLLTEPLTQNPTWISVKSLNHSPLIYVKTFVAVFTLSIYLLTVLALSFKMSTRLRRRKRCWILLYLSTYRTLVSTCCRCKAG